MKQEDKLIKEFNHRRRMACKSVYKDMLNKPFNFWPLIVFGIFMILISVFMIIQSEDEPVKEEPKKEINYYQTIIDETQCFQLHGSKEHYFCPEEEDV